jgi:hypothetical protein
VTSELTNTPLFIEDSETTTSGLENSSSAFCPLLGDGRHFEDHAAGLMSENGYCPFHVQVGDQLDYMEDNKTVAALMELPSAADSYCPALSIDDKDIFNLPPLGVGAFLIIATSPSLVGYGELANLVTAKAHEETGEL